MGNNAAFSTFENIVIKTYDHGTLTPRLLDDIGSTWQGMDVDHGGCRDLRSADGKGIHQIVVQTFQPSAQPHWDEDDAGREDSPYHMENGFYEAFNRITRAHWDWC